MSLLVVTAFCAKDWKLAVQMYDWIGKLGGIKHNDVLLVTDKDENTLFSNRVLNSAKRVAKSVTRIYTTIAHEKKWPDGANAAFISTAKYCSDAKRSFIWLEPDCVPTRQGWLDLIEKEYAKCGKQYMGEIVTITQPNGKSAIRGLMGVAVYPSTVEHANTVPTNVPFDMHIGTKVIPNTHHSASFQWFGGPGEKRVPPTSLSNIRPRTLIFHSDKSGRLIELLNETKPKEKQNVSIVITSHNRISRLFSAYNSCLNAGIEDIVATMTGYSDEDRKQIEQKLSGCTLVFNQTDDSNLAWIAGVKAAKHDRITILHDDDKVLPDFIREVSKYTQYPFIVWPATFHNDENTRNDLCDGPFDAKGETPTKVLFDSINIDGRLSITPVRGLFRKEDLISWLTEAGNRLGQDCYYRKDYLIGNDLWIYLRASTQYRTFYSMNTPVTSLGCNSDSCTMDAIKNDISKLERIYNVTRSTFATNMVSVESSLPLHVVTIVLDGAPFLVGQLQVLNRLKLDWKWSIVEGVAEPNHCTYWCKHIDSRLSNDDTGKILDDFSHHKRIRVLRNATWDGKISMVNAPLDSNKRCEILMQIDVDEFWEAWQIERIHKLFVENPKANNAMFWCRYFVGPGLVMTDRNCYANNPNHEWRRAWRRDEHQRFLSHEPPILSGDQSNVITHKETEALGLVFDHYSYVLRSQVAFKEQYYGFASAVKQWEQLQMSEKPRMLSEEFEWAVNGGAVHIV